MIALTFIVMERRIRPAFILGGFAAIVLLYPFAQFYREFVQISTQIRAVEVLSDPGRVIGLEGFGRKYLDIWRYIADGQASTGDHSAATDGSDDRV